MPNENFVNYNGEGAKHIYDLLEKYESLPADSNIQSELEQQISANDAWNIDTRIKAAMMHLNAPDSEHVRTRAAQEHAQKAKNETERKRSVSSHAEAHEGEVFRQVRRRVRSLSLIHI